MHAVIDLYCYKIFNWARSNGRIHHFRDYFVGKWCDKTFVSHTCMYIKALLHFTKSFVLTNIIISIPICILNGYYKTVYIVYEGLFYIHTYVPTAISQN